MSALTRFFLVCMLAALAGCGSHPFGSVEAIYEDASTAPDVASSPDISSTPAVDPLDEDGDGYKKSVDCDDKNVNVNLQSVWLKDADGDDWGSTVTKSACTQPEGYVAPSKGGDCDDQNSFVHPSAIEICNGQDDDCDGVKDNATGNVWYLDSDGDGHGDPTKSYKNGCTGANFLVAVGDDCDDTNSDNRPGASEVCDHVDNNCNGQTDEDAVDASTWYVDKDGDGHGTTEYTKQSCEMGPGMAKEPDDCDDANAVSFPGASEACDGLDNDCDGKTDEDVKTAYFKDADVDGFGTKAADGVQYACLQPQGYVLNNLDCDDDNALSFPGAAEFCDGKDNNCNGEIDESKPDVNLCDDGKTLTIDICSSEQAKCLYEDVTITFACELPPEYSKEDGYYCGSAAYYTGDKYNEVKYEDGDLELPAKDVCAIVKSGKTLYVNSFVAFEGDLSSILWVGGQWVAVTDSLGGKSKGSPGNVSVLSPGLDFYFKLADLAICQ